MNNFLGLFMSMISLIGCSGGRHTPPKDLPSLNVKAVQYVDLEKYSGRWYEIASFPMRFQKGCTGTSATYTLSKDSKFVIVYNKCYKDSLEGKVSDISGKAFVVPNSGNAKLKVQFFWPFKADYWIIHLDDDYSHAVVSEPDGEYLWILSRNPKMDEQKYEELLNIAFNMGIDVSKLKKTFHGDN